jgi:hypothetical protein
MRSKPRASAASTVKSKAVKYKTVILKPRNRVVFCSSPPHVSLALSLENAGPNSWLLQIEILCTRGEVGWGGWRTTFPPPCFPSRELKVRTTSRCNWITSRQSSWYLSADLIRIPCLQRTQRFKERGTRSYSEPVQSNPQLHTLFLEDLFCYFPPHTRKYLTWSLDVPKPKLRNAIFRSIFKHVKGLINDYTSAEGTLACSGIQN